MHRIQFSVLSLFYRDREAFPSEVTESILKRINTYDGALHSYLHVMSEQARVDAERADDEIGEGRFRGPLHGVPIAVKDQFWVAGTPTTAGTTVLRGNITQTDSEVVRKLRNAGAVIMGKLAMAEAAFGYEHPQLPAVSNPWHPDLWEGSSSSGAGAAVAAHLCHGAIATDTGGSIRYPAAMTGLTALKPTLGSVSSQGVVGSSPGSMEHIGPMARSASDCESLFEAITDRPYQPAEDVYQPLRIGIDPYDWAGIDAPTAAVLRNAQEVFAGLGQRIYELSMPDASDVVSSWRDRCAVDLAIAYEETFPARREEFGPLVADLLDRGRSLPATDLRRILVTHQEYSARLQEVFILADVLLMPVIGVAAPTRE